MFEDDVKKGKVDVLSLFIVFLKYVICLGVTGIV